MTFRMDPRAKLYLLLLANLMLLFHVGTGAEAAATALCLLLFFLSGKARAGVRLSVLYFGLLAVDLFVVPRAGESVLLNLLSSSRSACGWMLPCIITGAYAFSTTTVGELTAALRRMHLPESIHHPLCRRGAVLSHRGRGLPPHPRGHGCGALPRAAARCCAIPCSHWNTS
mgnify:CR=1 FL=1